MISLDAEGAQPQHLRSLDPAGAGVERGQGGVPPDGGRRPLRDLVRDDRLRLQPVAPLRIPAAMPGVLHPEPALGSRPYRSSVGPKDHRTEDRLIPLIQAAGDRHRLSAGSTSGPPTSTAAALWVPIIRSWALTWGFALHPGTRNRYKMRYTRTQDQSASRQVNDHGRVGGATR